MLNLASGWVWLWGVFFFLPLPVFEEVDLGDDALLFLVSLKSVTNLGGVGHGHVFEALSSFVAGIFV